jgi:mono/diheme cytochrome c family protein
MNYLLRPTRLRLLSCVFLALVGRSSALAEEVAERLFTLKVYPLLERKCVACHGQNPDGLKGEFDIRSRESILRGGESDEPALVPGKPDESLMMRAVRWESIEMPPKKNDRLTTTEIEHVGRWIAAGAPWPDEEARQRIRIKERSIVENEDGVLVTTSGGLSDEWTYRRYKKEDIWAFRSVTSPDVPATVPHPVDAFVARRIAGAKLTSAPPADARTLLRRASYDLTGLPPKPRELTAFLDAWAQDSEKAWSDLIGRLLSSPHYGERWGQHWLDVVRYADTAGFSNDYERSNAWRYRDYVVRSFNEDKPFDEFIVEQIAGDELRPDDPDAIVATGFLRMGPWGTAMIPQEEARQIFRDDVVQSVSQSFLSTPMRCARCHDHKFDPIPTRDYYRLYAAFSATQPAEMPAAFSPVENRRGFAEKRKLVEKLFKYADDDRLRVVAKREAAAKQWYAAHDLPYKSNDQRRKDPENLKPPRHVGLDYVDQGTLKVREQDCWIWKRRLERYEPLAQSVFNGPDRSQNGRKLRKPRAVDKSWRSTSFIFLGGDRNAKGAPVTPGVPSGTGVAAVTTKDGDRFSVPDGIHGRRLALARWIADPANPLATRSIVNRIWQHHFGRGIVRTPNNFGAKGSKPTHPELLDWLTNDFVENGWRIKRLHRLIMMSRTYRQSGAHPDRETLDRVDPTGDLLASFPPRLLTAEEIRDSLLAISGELNPEVGGVPVRPEINLEVALEPRMIQFSIAPAYQPSRTPRERNRRSIYTYRVRGQADPFLEILNLPNPNDSCASRESTAVTPQAFTLLNSDVMMDRSIAMAIRLRKQTKDLAMQIRRAFRLTYGRSPAAKEQQRLVTYLREMEDYHAAHPPKPVTYPKQITRSLVEELSGKPFEYVEWLAVYEGYVPDSKPWTVDAPTRALADVCLLLFNSNAFLYIY